MTGVFVTIDGPGGAGKSTTTRLLCRSLAERGYPVHATTEPSYGHLGQIARHGTDTYSGHALACLVAADRYHHLRTEIHPKLATGHIVVCDRYVASSYILQRLDGVPIEFIEAINAPADIPHLAVILTANPLVTTDRIARRGAHNRFESGVDTSRIEAELCADTVTRLAERRYPLMTIDSAQTSPEQVVAMITERTAQLAGVPHPAPTRA